MFIIIITYSTKGLLDYLILVLNTTCSRHMPFLEATQILNTIIMFGQSNTLWNRVLSSTEAENCHTVELLSQPLLGLEVWVHNLGSPKQTHLCPTSNWKQSSSNNTSQFPEAAAAKVPVLVCSVCPLPLVLVVQTEASITVVVLVVSSKAKLCHINLGIISVTYPSSLVPQSFHRFGRLLTTTADFCCL